MPNRVADRQAAGRQINRQTDRLRYINSNSLSYALHSDLPNGFTVPYNKQTINIQRPPSHTCSAKKAQVKYSVLKIFKE